MAKDNETLVLDYLEAIKAGDHEAAYAAFAEDATWQTPPSLPWPGLFHGRGRLPEQQRDRDVERRREMAQIGDRGRGEVALHLAEPADGPVEPRREAGKRQPPRLAQRAQVGAERDRLFGGGVFHGGENSLAIFTVPKCREIFKCFFTHPRAFRPSPHTGW